MVEVDVALYCCEVATPVLPPNDPELVRLDVVPAT